MRYRKCVSFFLLFFSLWVNSCKDHLSNDNLDCGERWIIASETTSINGQDYLFVKKNGSKIWELFGECIAGFKYQPGHEYSIVISRSWNDDVGKALYSLIRVLSIQQKKSEQIPLFSESPLFGEDLLEIAEDENFIQGDMVFSPEQINDNLATRSLFVKDRTKYWPNNTVYYTYGPGFSGQSKVSSAITEWENKTSLSFVYGTGNGNYIEFIDNTRNFCSIGMVGGKQVIGLMPFGGSTAGSAMHEIGHAVGLQHEHCRYDRTGSIVVYTENIENGREHNFALLSSNSNATIGTVDFSSIMMYSSWAFSKNGLATMKTPEGGTWSVQRSYLSELDVDGVSAIYGPPYHYLNKSISVLQDYVYWIDEVYEENVTYTINIYANKQYTQGATLKYARPITLYRTHQYYDSDTDQIYEDHQTLNITIPAGASYYSVGTVHNIEHYQMSDPYEIDITTYSIDSPHSTMYN